MTFCDVDDHHVLAVGARLAHAGVAVDGHIRQAAVRRRGDLVAGDSALYDRHDDLARRGIDNGQAGVAFLSDQQVALLGECCGRRRKKQE